MSPLLYEINARCWLRELGEREARPITLDTVPSRELDEWQRFGFSDIWLMGIWPSTQEARRFSLDSRSIRQQARTWFPDLQDADITGSPYAIAGYQVPESWGGELGLQRFRRALHARGLRLILDYIPNHVGLGHIWLSENPELFVHSRHSFRESFPVRQGTNRLWIAQGKDPYFPAWADTAQLDYRNPATQTAMIAELKQLARRCDGVRCDMAMLLLQDVFARNWRHVPSGHPETRTEFWAEAIKAVRRSHPAFQFLAEAYWELEAQLLALGFDYVYDKRVLDLLLERHAHALQSLLRSRPPAFLKKSIHFLENHDEPRIAPRLTAAEHACAALLMFALPGMRLIHEGQLTGARSHASVHLNRRVTETPQPEITAFYGKLLRLLPGTAVGKGTATLLAPVGTSPNHSSAQSLIVIQWQSAGPEFDLVAINLAGHESQARVPLPIPGGAGHDWSVRDLLGQGSWVWRGAHLANEGVFLALPPHAARLYHCAPTHSNHS